MPLLPGFALLLTLSVAVLLVQVSCAVRTVPADPTRNWPETNMPISRLLWQVIEVELGFWGQVTQRLDDFKKIPPIRDYRRNEH